MTNYDELSLEELEKLQEERKKAALVKQFKEADDERVRLELEEHDKKVKADAIQEYIDGLNTNDDGSGDIGGKHEPIINTPEAGITQPEVTPNKPTKKYDGDPNWSQEYNGYSKAEDELKDIEKMYREAGLKMDTEYGGEYEDHNTDFGAKPFSYVAGTDNGCDETSQLENNWSVSQNFCNFVWHAKECYMGLGFLCASVCDIKAGDNARLDIKVISARSDPNSVSACTCLSCASNTFTKYSITINQLGDYAVLCSWDEFQVGSSYRRAVLKSMAEHWGVYFDAQIWAALAAATAGYTETLNNTLDCNGVISGSCCTNGSDIYGRLIDLDARMRVAGYMPDYFICSPTVANYFKYLQHPTNALATPEIEMKGGILTRIGHIKVVEYCGATACSTATALRVGVLIDSSRAIGQAFGKRPTLEFERDPECNSTKIVMWAYWGVSALDSGALGIIVTPNA